MAKRSYALVSVSWLLIAVAFLTAEHGLWSIWASVAAAQGLSCPRHVRSNFPDQGSNPCALHWQADAHALQHQGSPCLLVLGHMRQALHHQDPCFEQEASSLCRSRCGPSVPPLWTGEGRGVEAMGLRCTTGVSASHAPLERSGSPSGQSGECDHWRSGAASGRDTAGVGVTVRKHGGQWQ